MSQDSIKLNRELRFIEDSFSSGIISKSEYDEAKKRVQDKLDTATKLEENQPKEQKKLEPQVEVYHDEPKRVPKSVSTEERPQVVDLGTKHEDKQERPEVVDIKPGKPAMKLETYGGQKKNKKILYLTIIVVALILYFILQPTGQEPQPIDEVEFTPVCGDDMQCFKSGFIGRCVDPGTKDAVCAYEQAKDVEITIIDSDDCTICNSDRIKNTLLQIYPGAEFETVDLNDAGTLVRKHDIDVLPAFILDNGVEDTSRWTSTKSALIESGDSYLLKPLASGGAYFLERPSIKGKIDIFIDDSEVSRKAFENIEELGEDLDVHFFSKDPTEELLTQVCLREIGALETYLACTGDDCLGDLVPDCNARDLLENDMELAQNLYINTAPVFLFNNQFKKGGSLSVDILEDTFCSINSC